MIQSGSRTYGILLVAAAAVLWSTAGLFVRMLELDAWTILAWRSVFAAAALFLLVLYQHGPETAQVVRAVGLAGLAAIPIAAVSMGSYVLALKLTSVANVMVIYATAPFVAAGIALAWTGERTNPKALIASAVALVGIFILVGGATTSRDLTGNGVAFLMTLAFAIQLVMARRYPKLEMSVVNAMAAALCALICWLLTPIGVPSSHQLVILALFGVTTTALAYLLFLTGGRYLPSGEAGLIGLLDVVLGPFWVWAFFAERPGAPALIGGGLVLASVCWYLSSQLRIAAT